MSKSNGSGKPRVQLSPAEKYELWIAVLTGECTQRQGADRWGVDRSTVVGICRTAKQAAGRARVRSRRRSRMLARRPSGCGRRWPSRRWRCISSRENRVVVSLVGDTP